MQISLRTLSDYSNIEYIDVEQRTFAKRHLENGDLIVEKSGGSDNNPVGRTILRAKVVFFIQ